MHVSSTNLAWSYFPYHFVYAVYAGYQTNNNRIGYNNT